MTATTPEALDPAPFTFEGVVRFTRIGASYLVLTVVIGFAALNTGNNALYIALTFMLGCLLLSGIASKGGLKHLVVELQTVDDPWAGRPAHATLLVINRSRIWNVRDVVITSAELAAPILVPLLERRKELFVNADLLFARRGIVQFKSVDLYTRYPFGFFLKKRRLRFSGEVVVYPRLLDGEERRERFLPVAGEQSAANRPGPGTEVHSFREYVRGDSLRHVYWKKSAGLGRWIMRQTELEAARAVHVAFDPYRPPGVTNEQFEELVSAAATFVHQALGRGLDVLFTLPRMTMEAGAGQPAGSIFRALALIEPSLEPVYQPVDLSTILFTLRRDDDAPRP
ncbi:MAG: uncharacterized protein JWN02_1646 [Acidobacteria bacterium]|nr:uncharacterized protein [Acidobacteriota bacterium]